MRRVPPALLGLALLLAGPVFSQDKPDKSLHDQLDAACQGFKAKNAKLAVCVHSVKTGAVVFAQNEREPLMLASNTKLLTGAAALCRLGPEFKFRTSIGVAGGDVHVFAGGDPNVSGRFH